MSKDDLNKFKNIVEDSISDNKEMQEILSIPNNDSKMIRPLGEGGFLVYRIEYDYFIVFDIPQYGGETDHIGTYHKSNLKKLFDEINNGMYT